MISSLLHALSLVAREGGSESSGSTATVHATSDLTGDTRADLGRTEKLLRVQNRVRTRVLRMPCGLPATPVDPVLHWVATEELSHSTDDLV